MGAGQQIVAMLANGKFTARAEDRVVLPCAALWERVLPIQKTFRKRAMSKPCLGILSLDTAFPRISGDVGNVGSYPFDAMVEVLPGADSPQIVRNGAPSEGLLIRFEAAARKLERRGATAIVSTCGFLAPAQGRIADAVSVPVMLSALSLLPLVRAIRPGCIGVLTASEAALGDDFLQSAGLQKEGLVIAGMENVPAFADTFLAPREKQATKLDRAAMEAGVVTVAQDLLARAPDVTALLLECGNLPPYANALRQATGRRVYHLVDAARFIMEA